MSLYALQAYFMLDEMLLAGELQEPSKKAVTRVIEAQDQLVSIHARSTMTASRGRAEPSCALSGPCWPAGAWLGLRGFRHVQVENAKQGGAPTAVAGLSGIAVDRSRAYS